MSYGGVVAPRGVEPLFPGSEPGVLPLDDGAVPPDRFELSLFRF